MSYDTIQRNLKDCVVTLKDGDSAEVVVVNDNGGISITKPRSAVIVRDRGSLTTYRPGPDEPIAWTLEMDYSTLESDTGDSETNTPYEMMTGEEEGSGLTSTTDHGVHTFDMEAAISNPASSGKDEKITLADCHADSIEVSEGEETDTLRASGTALSMAIERTV